jgi:Ca2+/H+ antiporter
MKTQRSTERGSATLKFLIVMAIIGACAYAGYLYVPVAYHAHTFKDLMQHYVDVASAEGKPAGWAGEQIIKNFGEYEVPANAVITPAKRDNRIEVRIQYVKPVEFPGYTYNYEFDHTATSTAFLDFK